MEFEILVKAKEKFALDFIERAGVVTYLDSEGVEQPLTEEMQDFLDNPPPAPPPSSVTMRQARLALLEVGVLSQVDEAINSLPEPQKSAAKIEWEYSQEVQRDKPFTKQLALGLGLSAAQLDALFTRASQL